MTNLSVGLILKDQAGARFRIVSIRKAYDESQHPRDSHGRWSATVGLPAEPGTVPIPEGHVRLYHQTTEESAEGIRVNGIQLSSARGIEGPRAIYADEKGFYGKPGDTPTVEFHVPKDRWTKPFVRADSEYDKGMVAPENIIAIHYPWHGHARYIENDPEVKAATLAGQHDRLLNDRDYGPAIRHIKAKYSVGKAFNPDQERDDHGRWTTVYRGIWGPDKAHELSGGLEAWSAERPVAESYARTPNDPVLLAEAGGVTDPKLITAHLSPNKLFSFGNEPRIRIDEIKDRLRLDKEETNKLIDDLDKFNEKDNPRFQNWEYGDSKVFQGLLRDRGYDVMGMPGSFIHPDGSKTNPLEYRVLNSSALRRVNVAAIEKVFNPDQPRGKDGKWTSGGGSLGSLHDFLKMTAKMGSTQDKFILEHGKQYKYDASSFEGKRDEPNMCYMNAGRIALNRPDRTYVEGYITVHGVPLKHAWTVDDKGKVHDSTLKHDKDLGGFFGVPFQTDYVAKTALKTKVWGIISHTNRDLFKAHDTSKIIKFNPDEPRDSHGRWTVGGSTTPAEDLLALHHDGSETIDDVNKQLTPGQKFEIEKAEAALKGQTPTNVLFMGADGKYTPEREALHNKILDDMFNEDEVKHAMTKPGEDPTLTLTGGRPASGKTSTLKNELGDTDKNSMYISADTIQEHLPGYDGKKAGLFNGEAQDIALQAEKIARRNRLNITYDATLKSQQPALDRVKTYQDEGYKVNGYFVHTSPVTSAVRSAQRYMDTGRYVPPAVSLKSMTNEKTFDALIPHLDKWAIYDNNGAKPKLVARGVKANLSKFNPDEARDYHGRWTAGGSGEEIDALATSRGHPGSKKRQVYNTYKKYGLEAAQQHAQALDVTSATTEGWTTLWNEQGTPPGTATGFKLPTDMPPGYKPRDVVKPYPPKPLSPAPLGKKLRLWVKPGYEGHGANVQRGIDAIPAHHQALLAQRGTTIAAVPTIKRNYQGVHISRPFTTAAEIKVAAHTKAGRYGNLKVQDPVGTTVHELGHGVDHASGWDHGNAIARHVTVDADKGMTMHERASAQYFFSNDKERFAELYRTAYSPGPTAFNMPIEKARTVFATSIAKMKERVG